MSVDPVRLKRARIRAWRRGMKEMDLILGPFADQPDGTFTESDLQEFEALLDENDQDLYAWFCEKGAAAKAPGGIMEKIRQFHKM